MGVWNIVTAVGLLITIATCIPVLLQMRKHPKGLHILFFAEMWERFSYYGMRALLVFYLTKHFLFDDAFAGSQYGAYTSLVYLTPLIGGILADRYLGTRKAIAFGALLLVGGHLAMAIEGPAARETLSFEGQTYSFVVEGRGDAGEPLLEVDGNTYRVQSAGDGGLSIVDLPAGASLPSVLPAGSFEKGVEGRSPLYLGIFYLALSLIIVGVGFLKGNISAIVGQLYTEGDPRRDPGFTLYYYGINLGAFWAAILCGALGETYGWGYGFGLAGVGMALGWLVFVRGRLLFFTPGESQLPAEVGRAPDPQKLRAPILAGLSREMLIYGSGIALVGLVFFLVQSPPLAVLQAIVGVFGQGLADQPHAHIAILLAGGSIAVLAFIAWVITTQCNAIERGRMLLALFLIAVSTVFWTFFEQAGSSLNLFADRNTQMPSSGFFTVTASQTQAFNAGFILIFAPIFAGLWAWLGSKPARAGGAPSPIGPLMLVLGLVVLVVAAIRLAPVTQPLVERIGLSILDPTWTLIAAATAAILGSWVSQRGLDPNSPLKFSLALLQLGVGFFMLVIGAQFADENWQVPLIFLALLYLFHTTGELCLSPVGLSSITKLSIAPVVSTMMAMWFLSSAWAQYVGGLVAGLTASETLAGTVLDPRASLDASIAVFEVLGWIAIGLGVVVALVSWPLGLLAREGERAR